jgi:hypothetical protein
MEYNETILNLDNPTILDLPNGDMYIVCGTDKNTSFANSLYFYNNSTSIFEKKKDLDFHLYNFSITKYEDFLYIFGGRTSQGSYFKQVYRYDIVNDMWESLIDVLGISRVCHSCIVYNDKLYIIGGVDQVLENSEIVKVFDLITNNWVISSTKEIIFPSTNLINLSLEVFYDLIFIYSKDQVSNRIIRKMYVFDPIAISWEIYRNLVNNS